MRLNEFYDPESDKSAVRNREDVRKQKLTLKDINKLRKYRDIKRLETEEHLKIVSRMYAAPASAGGDSLL